MVKNYYAVVARNVMGDWRILKDALTLTDALTLREARKYRESRKKDYDIIRVYKFIEGDV